jgi:hypothetical protein
MSETIQSEITTTTTTTTTTLAPTTVDFLTEDPIINNQKYVCVSFLKPSSVDDKYKENKQTTVCGFKIRGCYATEAEAHNRAKFLQQCDPYHNIYVGEVGKWCPFEDDPEKAKDNEYMNKELNDLMKSYWNQQTEAKQFHEIRKQEMVNKALEAVALKKASTNTLEVVESKKKRKNKHKQDKILEMKSNLDIEKEELSAEKQEIDSSITTLRKLEEELDAKIREMKESEEKNES